MYTTSRLDGDDPLVLAWNVDHLIICVVQQNNIKKPMRKPKEKNTTLQFRQVKPCCLYNVANMPDHAFMLIVPLHIITNQVELHVIQPTPEFANCRNELLHVLHAVITSLQKQRVCVHTNAWRCLAVLAHVYVCTQCGPHVVTNVLTNVYTYQYTHIHSSYTIHTCMQVFWGNSDPEQCSSFAFLNCLKQSNQQPHTSGAPVKLWLMQVLCVLCVPCVGNGRSTACCVVGCMAVPQT